ncbi:tetratricopeptide repeat protein [Bacillus sp. RO1]|uniref:tetratricopeptide repeat protein n=1 Tax=Bacillus sp. RO1 TaxID=2722703 RepID=UPI00145792CB|nr:tetratricopeptide repeat protein [Bacillus sp. RO1]NLP52800.1 tetratricopeptide repeat protein [Bacillus sp. RO1]
MSNLKNHINKLSRDTFSLNYNLDQGIVGTFELSEGHNDCVKVHENLKFNTPVEKLLYTIYDLTVLQNKKAAREKFQYLNDEFDTGSLLSDPSINLLYLVVKLKFSILNNDRKLYQPIYNQIRSLPTSINPSIEYIHHKTLGIYYYRTNNFLQSTLALDNALSLAEKLPHISANDKAELYYQVALTKLKTCDTYESIFFADKALSLYQSLYNNKRSAECHIILGINFNHSKRQDFAEKHYLSAKNIGETIGDSYLESMALHNLGCIKSYQKQSEEAIYYYLESLKRKREEERSVYSILGLVEEYYFLGQTEFSKEWAEQGLRLAVRTDLNEYILHFTTHIYLLDKDRKLELYIQQEVIPYFKNAGNERYTIKYTEMLAKYYYENQQYKLASEFFNSCLQNIKSKTSY